MNKIRQLSANQQRNRMRRYLHTLRANYERASRDLFSTGRIRRGCPLQLQLKHKRFSDAYELLQIGERCLKELNHCYALRIAGFRPGDHILVTIVIKGFAPSPHRYIVQDVVWKKGDGYYYEVQELTKSGAPHRGRYPTWLSPSNRVSIEYCDQPLGKEGTWLADRSRSAAKQLLKEVLETGDISQFLPKPPPQHASAPASARQYPFWLRQT